MEDDASESIEQTCEKIQMLLVEKLELDIINSDIDVAHRIGKFDGHRQRPIIVKFMCRRKKIQCIQNRYKPKKTGIVIKDDLS